MQTENRTLLSGSVTSIVICASMLSTTHKPLVSEEWVHRTPYLIWLASTPDILPRTSAQTSEDELLRFTLARLTTLPKPKKSNVAPWTVSSTTARRHTPPGSQASRRFPRRQRDTNDLLYPKTTLGLLGGGARNPRSHGRMMNKTVEARGLRLFGALPWETRSSDSFETSGCLLTFFKMFQWPPWRAGTYWGLVEISSVHGAHNPFACLEYNRHITPG